jgi:hypothetical protein
VAEAAATHGASISGEVLAEEWIVLPLTDAPEDATRLEVDGQAFGIALRVR